MDHELFFQSSDSIHTSCNRRLAIVYRQSIYTATTVNRAKEREMEKKKIAVGVASGGMGATIGGLIGALAAGIPSFGLAAGAGAVIGAVLGGGMGVVASASTGAKPPPTVVFNTGWLSYSKILQ